MLHVLLIIQSCYLDCKPEHRIVREEIFGPVAAIAKFKDQEEVINLANDTSYGLGAAVFTSNISTAINVSNRLEAGSVCKLSSTHGIDPMYSSRFPFISGVNCYNIVEVNAPFGGYKQSGIGRENGEYALENYYQVKSIKINIDKSA